MHVALLDAACLVPAVLTDTLLRLAENSLYRPLWSPTILEEVRRAALIIAMRLTLDLPDEVVRRLTAEADRRGARVVDVIADLATHLPPAETRSAAS